MDEFLTCSMNCQDKPVYACSCCDENILLCTNHCIPHAELECARNHHFTRIMKNLDPQTKIIISKFLKGIKLQVKQSQLKISQESSLLIKQINEEANNSFKNLLLIEKRLDEYISLCYTLEEINNLNSHNFVESLLKLSAEDAEKIKYEEDVIKINNDKLNEKIKYLFTVQGENSLFDIDKFNPRIIKFFKDKELFAVDLMSKNLTSQNINKNWQRHDPTCLLEDESVFCCFQGETFIIAPNNSIEALDSSQYSKNSGLIAVDDFVYMFGGNGNASLKFSLKSKNWTALAQYPVPENRFISCACIRNVILIGGDSEHIYGYNVLNNLFAKVPIKLNSGSSKTCLATKNITYIIEYGKNYYESGWNDISTWTSIGDAKFNSWCEGRHSYSLHYGNNFYFVTSHYKLIQFNLKNKELKHLKTS